MPSRLDASEKLAWLRLARTPQVGPATFLQLVARFGTAAAALDQLPRLARRGGGAVLTLTGRDEAAREIANLEKAGGRLIASCEEDFPEGLGALDPPPPVISVTGCMKLLGRDMVAVVGARNASALARKFASVLARDLTEAGLVVVSGLARGIDAAAHEAALPRGTVAVVAGGVDTIYPPENESLHRAISHQGAVVSEMPFGEAPKARHFPRRNRLISGLARGVVVVEAAERSGSLITARYALEQGREIFAVPGSPLDPRAKGPNRLIREGATLIESAADVVSVLAPMRKQEFHAPGLGRLAVGLEGPSTEDEADRIRARVEEGLGAAPVGLDELIRQTGGPASAVLTVVLELELAGRCRRHAGNRVSWATTA
ncbi:MAG: DNA-processing protein DprA [Rhizomicrobium sp.]